MDLPGLRRLSSLIDREAKQMPILNDIVNHKIIGRERKRGFEAGLEHGRQVLLKMIVKRFGTVPPEVKKRVEALSAPGLERT